jgi:hypothetical protein
MQRIAEYARGAPLDDLEATQPYISAPWDAHLDVLDDADDGAQAAARAQETHRAYEPPPALRPKTSWSASAAPLRAWTGQEITLSDESTTRH